MFSTCFDLLPVLGGVRTCFIAVANEWLMGRAPDERLDWVEAGVSLCRTQQKGPAGCCLLGEWLHPGPMLITLPWPLLAAAAAPADMLPCCCCRRWRGAAPLLLLCVGL